MYDKAIVKLFRRVEPGVNPDLEIGQCFAERCKFANSPSLMGAIEYRNDGSEPLTIAVAHQLVPQAETAWQFALDNLSRYFEQILTHSPDQWPKSEGLENRSFWELSQSMPPHPDGDLSSGFTKAAGLLGQRTAEMHVALSCDSTSAAFGLEPFTQLYQRSLYQSARKAASQNLQRLHKRLSYLSPRAQEFGAKLVGQEKQLFDRLKMITSRKINASRIRCHGDYHLGQVLYTGKDFMIIDFEGEPARSLSEHRMKASPLADVAGMIRSLHYAAAQGFNHLADTGLPTPENTEALKSASRYWAISSISAFLHAYHAAAGSANFFPASAEDRELLLNFYLLNKAVYEMGYELNNRPDWVEIPLSAIVYLLSMRI